MRTSKTLSVSMPPTQLKRVERLQDDHVEMAEALDALQKFAVSGPSGSELAARITQFLDRFDAHEHAENTLMQEFYTLDKGGGGQ